MSAKYYLAPFIIMMLIIFSATNLLAEEINLTASDFSVQPAELSDNSMLPLEKIADKSSLSVHLLESKNYLLIYNGRFLKLTSGSNKISTEEGLVTLTEKIIEINGHLFVPKELLNYLPGLKLVATLDDSSKEQALSSQLIIDDKTFPLNEKVQVGLEITNLSETKKVFNFNSGQYYDFFLRNEAGKIVYQWGQDKFFVQVITTLELPAGESKVLQEELVISDIPAGEYTLYGLLKSKERLITTPVKVNVK